MFFLIKKDTGFDPTPSRMYKIKAEELIADLDLIAKRADASAPTTTATGVAL
ncbi:hypothetical protein [Pedobacter agri]|uniref:hypothetical protein n=1 Tax=Pedobacter agri TaxID=454586 RepID=UPI002930942A|nr:hypothetical protein [Pedobacter agri]